MPNHAATLAWLDALEAADQAPATQAATLPHYQGARTDRLYSNWRPKHRAADDDLLEAWDLLTPRVRDLIRNEPSLGNAKRALVKHIIRTGIQCFAEATLPDGSLIEDYNIEADQHFERWADEEADVTGRMTWHELQWEVQDETIEVGESFLLKCLDRSPGRSSPLCYQLVEAEQLDGSKDQPAGVGQNRISRGVELDKAGRPVAYWIFDAHPYDSHSGYTNTSTRVPAERVLHNFIPFRPSMTRGVSWFHALLRATRDLDWYYGNELTTSALAALLVMVHKQEHFSTGGMGLVGDSAGEATSDDAGNPLLKWGRGTVARIGPNDDLKIAESARPNRDAVPFMKYGRQEQAMGAGISYLAMTGDFSQTSFTSAHGAANEDNAYILPLQKRFGHKIVLPVRREFTRVAVATGLIRSVSPTLFAAQPRRYQSYKLQAPGRDQLDPEKQTDAAVGRIRAGLSTLEIEAGYLGHNWRRLIIQRKREGDFAKEHGVELDFGKGGGQPKRNQVDNGPEVTPDPTSLNTLALG